MSTRGWDDESGRPARSPLIALLFVLNLVFGIVCGCSWGFYGFTMLMMPSSLRQGAQQASLQRFQQMQAIEERIAELDDAIPGAATTPGPDGTSEQQTLQAERTAAASRLDLMEKQGDPAVAMNAVVDVFSAPGMIGLVVCVSLSALLWNAGLIGFGIGLFGRRQWGRKGLIGLAAAKIAAEVALAAWIVLLVPGLTDIAIENVSAIPNADMTGAGQIRDEVRTQALWVGGVGSVLGAVYPAVLLVVLNLRSIRNEFEEWSAYRAGAKA